MKTLLALFSSVLFSKTFVLYGSELNTLYSHLPSGRIHCKVAMDYRMAELFYYRECDPTNVYKNSALAIAKQQGHREEQYEADLHFGVGYALLGNNIKATEHHILALTLANFKYIAATGVNFIMNDRQPDENFPVVKSTGT